VLRTCFPNSYEIRAVEWHPRRIHELLPVAGAGECHPHPAIAPARPYVAGVEYCGHAERRFDWQTPLVPFDAVTESTRATDRRGATATALGESRWRRSSRPSRTPRYPSSIRQCATRVRTGRALPKTQYFTKPLS